MFKSICLLLCGVAGLSLFVAVGLSVGHSAALNYHWTTQYLQAFSSGVWLPRHMPGLWAGLGGYDFFFYGPLPFWTTAALISPLCESCSVSNVIVAGAAFFWVLSGYTCFIFLSRHFGRIAALTGSLAYCVLPYHLLIDWYVRQALGEFAAYAFIPLMAYGVDAVRDNRTGKHWLSVGIAGMALCHLPTTLLAAHVFAFIVAFLAVDKLRRNDNAWRFLREAVFWSFLGVLLASFYWVPAIFLLD